MVSLGLCAQFIASRVQAGRRAARAKAFIARTPSPVPAVQAATPGPTAPPAPTTEPAKAAAPGAVVEGKNRGKSAGKDLFEEGAIPRLLIELSGPAIQALRRDERHYVRATVREGNTVYTNVAIHLKGSAGSFRPVDDTPSFTLNFDKFAEGQRFHGLKKIHLNRSIQDGSYLAEMISRELFNRAGLPTPRAGHAFVSVNGEDPQIYVVLEGLNRQFLKRHFTEPGGNVYDGYAAHDITERLKINEGEFPGDYVPLRTLAAAAREPDVDRRRERLEAVLDVDRFLSLMAMEVILGHWDGYTMNRNNYRVFHDRSRDRMVFLAHGMDQILNREDVALLRPRTAGLVARAVMEVPEFRARYRVRAAELATNVFQPEIIRARLREVGSRIDAVLMEKGAEAVAAHQRRVASLDRRIRQRGLSLERQLSPAPAVAENATSVPESLDWRSRVDLGDAQFVREKGDKGQPLLGIQTDGGCTASWRSRSRFSAGHYRLEASIRTREVRIDPADARAGAGFRISRHRSLPKPVPSDGWTPVRFEFDVADDAAEVELICELRARQGTLWFDPASVKLTRL